MSFAGVSLDRPRIMGIINVTPDSFSDGGDAFDIEHAVRRGRAMIAAGADILDIGGESTRPGATPVTIDQEIARVVPVIERLTGAGAALSVDTRHAPVMQVAIDAGAAIINDVTALSGDGAALGVVAASQASVILMHMQGDPGTMQQDPRYDDAAREVLEYLRTRVAVCEAAGIPRHRVAVDPGIGFGKTLAHNLEILKRLDLYQDIGCPLVLGVSRKSFIGQLTDVSDPKQRLPGSLAAALAGVSRGAHILRVHDVPETAQALAVWQGIEKSASKRYE